jgi:hypothetical protein
MSHYVFPDPDHAPTDPFTGEELASSTTALIAALKAEIDSLRCCCKCVHSDHDAPSFGNWWCEFDPEPMNPNEYSTIEPHENCHFSPSRWERITYSTDEDDVANSDRPLG